MTKNLFFIYFSDLFMRLWLKLYENPKMSSKIPQSKHNPPIFTFWTCPVYQWLSGIFMNTPGFEG